MKLKTPYYLVDERKLLRNLKIIKRVKDSSGAKSVLALKCFSTWSVFGLMRKYMDGTTASSPYEARLGYEKFGKEVHAYSVAYSREDISQAARFADKIIFNSISQLKKFSRDVRGADIGLRLNPGVSYSHFELADPACEYSRLGVTDKKAVLKILPLIKGVMFHFNCENDNFKNFSSNLDLISGVYGQSLCRLEWVSLGGGIYFTKQGYPLEKFCKKLKSFSRRFKVQVYLEPGESAITESAQLVTSVLDIVRNRKDIAIVDASTEAHMLDLLVYRIKAKIKDAQGGKFKYIIAGRSCLAGDVFGAYNFKAPLKVGGIIKFSDAAGYTMVKKNWFNGIEMPAIAIKRLNGKIDIVRKFGYDDFVNSL
ncbi:MAG: carboxynorspermidine decarboxylase [Candidatus Omnitrophica bacterium]|nr:carboxynorspermidine decarboxylase [Candidatus Omnitrophota bacterium]